MGLAENQLCHDLIEDWIKNNPEASICTTEGVSEFKSIANFQDYHGLPAFRQAMAKFMEKVRGGSAKFDPERIVMSGGATGAQELLAFCLADPGDAFLIPTPYYPGFDRDFRWRTGVQLIPIHCHSSNNFKITASAMESAYNNAISSDIKVKGILLTNPSNPLGTAVDPQTLTSVLTFAQSKRIHLVCDEIFAGTTFTSPKFTSISEILDQSQIPYDRNLIHVVYSLSKVLGLPGFRVGIVYSYNDEVVAIARKMSSFGLVSTQTQHFLAGLLSDDKFTTNFLKESADRLSKRHRVFTSGLEQVGIKCLESNAGLFCWMNLSTLLKEGTEEEEIRLWKVIIDEVKLNVSPGSSFHCKEAGWFRVCFANIDDETMEIALQRIRLFVAKMNGLRMTKQAVKRKSWKETSLRLSLSKKYEDMSIMSPGIMSPRSPMVHAAT